MKKQILFLALLAVILFAACPPSGRPTQVVHVCLISGQVAGPYCPPSVVEARKYYVSPQGDELAQPTEICTAHVKPEDPIDPPDPDPLVQVEVCAESSFLPGEWCVDRKTIEVRKSALPLAACTVHKAPRIAVYVGVYDLLVAEGDWREFLRKVKSAGGTGIRIFADCQWNWEGTRPFEYAAYDEEIAEKIRWKDPNDPKKIISVNGIMTLVRESGAQFPLYNYNRLRATYWTQLSEVLNYCRELRLTAWVVFIDYCTLKTPGDAKYFSPWYCAVQRMLPGIQNGVWGEQMKDWIWAFYRQVWGVVRASGVEFMIEDMNEGDALGWPDDFMLEWFRWSNQTMRSMLIPTTRIVTTAARNVQAIAALSGFYSPHGIGRPNQITPQSGGVPKNVGQTIFSSDGYWTTGGGGGCDAKGRCGPALADAIPLADALVLHGAAGYEWLPRMLYKNNNDRADLSLFDPAFLLRMTRGK